jgi:DNA-binding GntR family transcriptional regulator
MRTVFEKLNMATLRERIAEKMREAILTGVLREGERLVERKLAGQFATSLTAVREALIELEAEGFVTKKPNAATHVTRLTLDGAEKIFALRRLLEAFAVEEAARRASPEQLKNLERQYQDMFEAAIQRNAPNFIRRDFSFHEKIWEAAGNEYLTAALERVVVPIFAFSAIRINSCQPFDLEQDAQSHLPILEAIKGKDPEGARKAFLAGLEEWLSKTKAYVFGEPASEGVGSADHKGELLPHSKSPNLQAVSHKIRSSAISRGGRRKRR